jgi:hypothetical protein
MLRNWDSGPGSGKTFFSSLQRPDWLWVAFHSYKIWLSLQREVEHSFPSSVEVKKGGAISPLLVFATWLLNQTRNNFTLPLFIS